MITQEVIEFTTGEFMQINEGGVASTLMSRDYKDPPCVVVETDEDTNN